MYGHPSIAPGAVYCDMWRVRAALSYRGRAGITPAIGAVFSPRRKPTAGVLRWMWV